MKEKKWTSTRRLIFCNEKCILCNKKATYILNGEDEEFYCTSCKKKKDWKDTVESSQLLGLMIQEEKK